MRPRDRSVPPTTFQRPREVNTRNLLWYGMTAWWLACALAYAVKLLEWAFA